MSTRYKQTLGNLLEAHGSAVSNGADGLQTAILMGAVKSQLPHLEHSELEQLVKANNMLNELTGADLKLGEYGSK